VSRYKICVYENGDGRLSREEQERIQVALQAEAERLRSIATHIDFSPSDDSAINTQAPSAERGRT
jgi:hypothetical protein